MKNNLHKQYNKKRNHPSFQEYEESHHVAKKIKTHAQRKANNAIDKALKQNSARGFIDIDEYY